MPRAAKPKTQATPAEPVKISKNQSVTAEAAGAQELAVQPLDPVPFRKALSTWYRKHARVLPWRGVHNPYWTWLSEIMLQQTRVATVIERYGEFLHRFPTLADLAAAPEDDVLALWSGLGYYRRARMLHRGAQFVVRELGGQLPQTSAGLRTLPGVGQYTAAAVASIAFGEGIAVLDGNVERVLFRLLGLPEEKSAKTRTLLLRTANELVPMASKRRNAAESPGDHNQAMMELGATICLPRAPLCLHCPVIDFCRTRGQHVTTARAALRSRHVACLLATRKRGTATEVLLERRAAEASLMPGMLELPPLPLEAVEGREPVLRLRHSITNTNYYVEIFAEGGSGAPDPPPAREFDAEEPPVLPLASTAAASLEAARPLEGTEARLRLKTVSEAGAEARSELGVAAGVAADQEADGEANLWVALTEDVFRAAPDEQQREQSLRDAVPARGEDLCWRDTLRLYDQPLTGLARKALQRLGLMPMLPVRIGKGTGAV